MNLRPKRVVTLATNAELKNEHYYRRLWIAVKGFNLTRRAWIEELAGCFRDFDGEVVYLSGQHFEIPDLDELFGDDPDMRWMGYYLEPGDKPDFPKSKSWKLERLRMLDLYFRIRFPSIAQHFGR